MSTPINAKLPDQLDQFLRPNDLLQQVDHRVVWTKRDAVMNRVRAFEATITATAEQLASKATLLSDEARGHHMTTLQKSKARFAEVARKVDLYDQTKMPTIKKIQYLVIRFFSWLFLGQLHIALNHQPMTMDIINQNIAQAEARLRLKNPPPSDDQDTRKALEASALKSSPVEVPVGPDGTVQQPGAQERIEEEVSADDDDQPAAEEGSALNALPPHQPEVQVSQPMGPVLGGEEGLRQREEQVFGQVLEDTTKVKDLGKKHFDENERKKVCFFSRVIVMGEPRYYVEVGTTRRITRLAPRITIDQDTGKLRVNGNTYDTLQDLAQGIGGVLPGIFLGTVPPPSGSAASGDGELEMTEVIFPPSPQKP
jgi:hypothetical protein